MPNCKVLICLITATVMVMPIAFAAPKKVIEEATAKSVDTAFDPVGSFQSIVSRGMEAKEWTVVGQNSKTQKWTKRYYYLGEVKYDVKKTDSLVNPVVGVISFPVKVRFSPPYETETEANNSVGEFTSFNRSYAIDGKYFVAASNWKLDQFRFKDIEQGSALRGQEFIMDEAKLLAESVNNPVISNVLLRFLPGSR